MENNKKYERPSTIRVIRESNGLSQEYVASKLDITQQAIPILRSIQRMLL